MEPKCKHQHLVPNFLFKLIALYSPSQKTSAFVFVTKTVFDEKGMNNVTYQRYPSFMIT